MYYGSKKSRNNFTFLSLARFLNLYRERDFCATSTINTLIKAMTAKTSFPEEVFAF